MAGIAIVAVAIAALAAMVILRYGGSLQSNVSSTPLTSPVTTTSKAPPTTTSSVVPESPVPPQDFVAPGMPTSLEITCGNRPLVSTSLTKTGETKVKKGSELVVTPKVMGDTVALLSNRLAPWAVMPGSNAKTTTVVGHANYPQRMSLNSVAEYRGDTNDCQAVVTVPSGELTYGFAEAYETSKAWVSEAQTLSGRDNTLLVATCFSDGTSVFWEFQLESSLAR